MSRSKLESSPPQNQISKSTLFPGEKSQIIESRPEAKNFFSNPGENILSEIEPNATYNMEVSGLNKISVFNQEPQAQNLKVGDAAEKSRILDQSLAESP